MAVDNPRCRTGLPARRLTRIHHQHVIDPGPHPLVTPLVEGALNRRAGRAVLRQHPPLAARAQHKQDAVQHRIKIRRARPAKTAGRWKQPAYDRPFGIRRIACIGPPGAPILRAGDFSPGRGDSGVARNPTESQLSEITQLFLGQALRWRYCQTGKARVVQTRICGLSPNAQWV